MVAQARTTFVRKEDIAGDEETKQAETLKSRGLRKTHSRYKNGRITTLRDRKKSQRKSLLKGTHAGKKTLDIPWVLILGLSKRV